MSSEDSILGFTPLHSAAWNGHVEAGEYLIQQQPKLLNCVDNDGNTALMLAKREAKLNFPSRFKPLRKKK